MRTIGPRAVRLYPLYHPAAALYTPSMLETLRSDFHRIPDLLALGPPPQPEPVELPPQAELDEPIPEAELAEAMPRVEREAAAAQLGLF